jgi:pilus assembly protein CpaF
LAKKSAAATSHLPLNGSEREMLLRSIYDRVEAEPPLGERYPVLLRRLIATAIDESGIHLSKEDVETLADDLFGYVASYGPIQPFLEDPEVSEVMVNGPDQVFIEKRGEMVLTDVKYDSNEHVRFAINHVINPLGRYVNARRPLIDSRLPDGSRVNAIIPPASPYWPAITIRRFLKDKLTLEQLIGLGSFTGPIAEFMSVCVKARINIVVAGNTSSGKTTLLNILAQSIPDNERIVTVEDSAELSLIQTHKISLEATQASQTGEGAVTVRDLVRNCLRMRPDRIIVGEVRGGEAIDMLQAMNTGHDGSLTTVHSNSPRDTISRLETMVLMSGLELPVNAIRRQIASAIQMIIYLTRFPDGTRKLTQVSEISGMEGDVVTMTDLFQFKQTGVDEKRRIVGTHRATGLRPSFSPNLEAAGYKLGPMLFSNQGA